MLGMSDFFFSFFFFACFWDAPPDCAEVVWLSGVSSCLEKSPLL